MGWSAEVMLVFRDKKGKVLGHLYESEYKCDHFSVTKSCDFSFLKDATSYTVYLSTSGLDLEEIYFSAYEEKRRLRNKRLRKKKRTPIPVDEYVPSVHGPSPSPCELSDFGFDIFAQPEIVCSQGISTSDDFEKVQSDVIFSCEHLKVDWPTSFCLYSQEEGGCNMIFPRGTWTVLVDYCFGEPGRFEKGPSRSCSQQLKRVFCCRLFGRRNWRNVYPALQSKYSSDPDFADAFFRRNSDWVRDLTREGVESNPGPCVLSKNKVNNQSDLWSVIDFVESQGISDIFSIPSNIGTFTNDFHTFVDKLPDRSFVDTAFMSINNQANKIIELLSSTTTQVKQAIEESACAASSIKNVIIGVLVIIAFSIMARTWGFTSAIVVLVISFLLHHFQLMPLIQDYVMDSGIKLYDYIRQHFVRNEVVELQAFGNPIVDAMTNPDNMGALLAALFTALFVSSVKCHPATKDFEDLSRKVFNYQRGVTSVIASFDKLKEFWSFTIEKICDRFALNTNKDLVTKHTIGLSIDKWLGLNSSIFKEGYDTKASMENRLKFVERLRTQYNLGLDLINTCDRLDRAKAAIVRFWVDKLHKKIEELGTEALEGTVRNPPTTILLYGSSGVGKSSLITGLASYCAKIHSILEGVEQPAVGSVYVRNCDQAHYDGYTNQHTLVIDDFLSRKDMESNPNPEAGELIKIKNNVPFPLPMAHLPEKGRVFNSQVVIMTTNCKNVTKALGSMNFPYATANRLTDASFAVSILPEYRKYISPSQKVQLTSQGLLDQHSVDPYRTQFYVKPNKHLRPIPLTDDNMLNTYTDEEFESIKGERRLLPNGQIQYMNYDIYYFRKLDVKTGTVIGPPLNWTEFLNEIERVYTLRMTQGKHMLEQTKWFHTSSLAHMKQGIVDVPEHVMSQMINDDFDDGFRQAPDIIDNDDLDFAIQFAARNFDALHNVSQPAMVDLLNSYLARWPDFEDRVQDFMDRDVEAEEIQTRWQLMWSQCKEKYNQMTTSIRNMDVVQALQVAGLITYGVVTVGMIYFSFKSVSEKFRQPHIQKAIGICKETQEQANAGKNWFQKLFSSRTPIRITRDQVPLSGQDLLFLFEFCGYDVVQSQGGNFSSGSSHCNARNSKCKVYVPSHAFDIEEVEKVVKQLNLDTGVYGDGVSVDVPEYSVPLFLVKLESCQITDQSLDYIIPQNSFMLRIMSAKKGQKYDFGNVFFLDDRKFLMPHHYMKMIQYQLRVGNISLDDKVYFMRGPTTLERNRKSPPNKITCCVDDIMDFAQVISQAYLDDPDAYAKDAVVVGIRNMSGYSCSNMINKFITRSEYAKLNDPGLSGYLIGQRFTSSGDESYCTSLPCVDITPMNKFKYGGVNHGDLTGEVTAGPRDAPVRIHSLIRDRYNYKADTRQGDCGMVLFVESSQLQRNLVGIHVAGDRLPGRGNSVPLTQEDIKDAISRLRFCPSESFDQPELAPLEQADVDGIIPNVPKGDFHLIGKLEGKTPVQPLKTAIRPSVAQVHLPLLQDHYFRRTGKYYPIEVRKQPAHLRVAFLNPDSCRIYYGKTGSLMYDNGKETQPLTRALFDVWLAKGGVFHDVLMKGLEKTSLKLPYIPYNKIRRAVLATQQKFLRLGPNSSCPLEKALGQNYEADEFGVYEAACADVRRKNMIFECLESRKCKTPKEIYELTLRTVTLSPEEGAIFRQYLTDDIFSYVCHVQHELNLLTSKAIEENVRKVHNPMILTIRQSVEGIPGDRTIESINSKKSPGWPYTSLGLNFGKKPWVGPECKCDGERWNELERDVLTLIDTCKHSIPAIYFIATLKDELRSEDKVNNYKTRVFCAGPMHFTIVFRMYFMRFLSFVMENRLFNESALGINYYSREWETLADYLSFWDGPFCIAGDYTNFDGSLSNQIMEQILDIVQAFYDKYGATEEERTIRRNLWYCLTRSMVIGRNGCVFRLFNSQPSGNPYTTLINILFNSVVFRMAYADIMAEHVHLRRDIYDFEKDVHFISYGDDNAANINPEIIEYFNMSTISKQLAQYGLTYTDETKSDALIKGRRIDDINFLKRGFRRVNVFSRRWVAPLDIETVKEIFMWVRKGDENMRKKILADGVSTTLGEMSLHGEQVYRDWCTFVEGFEAKELLGKDMVPIPDFETQFIRVCEKDLDLNQFD